MNLSLTRVCRSRADGPLPGDNCPCKSCNGRIVVYSISHRGGFAIRYLCCNTCRRKPKNNKMIDADDNARS